MKKAKQTSTVASPDGPRQRKETRAHDDQKELMFIRLTRKGHFRANQKVGTINIGRIPKDLIGPRSIGHHFTKLGSKLKSGYYHDFSF